MPLNETSFYVSPYSGRDPEYAAALARAEDRASGKPLKASRPGDAVGIRRDGWIVCADGKTFYPEDLPAERLAHLPLLD